MNLNELYKPKISKDIDNEINYHFNYGAGNTQQLRNRLKKFGWIYLDEGVYSSVWGNVKKSYILKINKVPDRAFDHYVNIIKKSKNPHFPKISDMREIAIGPKIYCAYLIEKLFKIPGHFVGDNYSTFFNTIINADPKYSISKLFNNHIPTIFKKQPKLVDALCIVGSEHNNYFIDMHSGNIMQRKDGTIVITDPYA